MALLQHAESSLLQLPFNVSANTNDTFNSFTLWKTVAPCTKQKSGSFLILPSSQGPKRDLELMRIPDQHDDINHSKLLSCRDVKPGSRVPCSAHTCSNMQCSDTKQSCCCCHVLHKLLQLSPRMWELHLFQPFALRHYKVNYKMCQGGGKEKPC